MNTAAFYHKACDNYCYPLNERQLVISVRTGYDVESVAIYHGDPFQWGIMGGSERWCGTRSEILDVKCLKEHKLWSIVIEPAFKRCRYYFEFSDGQERVYFTENGSVSEEDMEDESLEKLDFYFPWMNSSDICTPPEWVSDTVWYQIFPDRFCNGNPSCNPTHVKTWSGPDARVSNEEVYGGDIAGIESRLDYLKDMGIGGIYLTPVNESSSTHKYDTDDYYKIDPAFGTGAEMKQMVRQAHEREIRVMLDGVFNHCGVGYGPWIDVVEKGPESKYFDWFMIRDWPFSGKDDAREGRYYAFAFEDSMPKLNTNHPEVIEELLKICTYWVTEYDIDALRLDVANEISHTFCKELKKRMVSLKPDFYIVGEIWHDSISWLRGDEFDSVMNYPLRQVITGLGMSQSINRDRFQQEINRCYSMYMNQTNKVLFNLLDSHDTIRLKTRLGDYDLFALQLLVLFTMTGSTCIYYGTETSMEGEHDPDCRRPMPWKEIESGEYNERIFYLKELIRMRKRYRALRNGECTFSSLTEDENVICYRKTSEGEPAVEVILNLSKEEVYVPGHNEGLGIVIERLYDGETGIMKPRGFLVRERSHI